MGKRLAATVLVLALAVAAWHLRQPPPSPSPPSPQPSPPADRVRAACATCHAFPDPASLARADWPAEIAKMQDLAAAAGKPIATATSAELNAYFAERAPPAVPEPPWQPQVAGLPAPVQPRPVLDPVALRSLAATSTVQVVDLFPASPGPEIVGGDMASGAVFWVDPDAQPPVATHLAKLGSVARLQVVDVDRDGRLDLLAADLGIQFPSDAKVGRIAWLHGQPDGTFAPLYLAQGLGRVADARAHDLDGDGDLDVAVAEFGWRAVGSLFVLDNISGPGKPTQFRRKNLDLRTGSLRALVADLDGDGRPDLATAFAQEHETVVAYFQRPDGTFAPRELFRGPHPHWGFNALEQADLDADGDVDLLMANGDAMDEAAARKPYHGVAWLENDGKGTFRLHELARFYGATGLGVADLDGDGDLDVTANAWLPARPQDATASPTPGVLWYEQRSPRQFVSRVLIAQPVSAPCHALADLDADGTLDLVTGRYQFEAAADASGKPLPVLDIWRLPRLRPAP